jgi:hypothetical protein
VRAGSRQRPRLAPLHGSPQRNGQPATIPTVLVAFIGVVVIGCGIATGKVLATGIGILILTLATYRWFSGRYGCASPPSSPQPEALMVRPPFLRHAVASFLPAAVLASLAWGIVMGAAGRASGWEVACTRRLAWRARRTCWPPRTEGGPKPEEVG